MLPRDVPLVVPLGEGYDWDQVAQALSFPPRLGLLPPLRFGWRGSGVVVAEELLGRLAANLLDSLRDDGFSRVYASCPPGLELGLGPNRLARRKEGFGLWKNAAGR